MSIIDTPIETLRKANQEANETRIKLNTLRACYVNLAQTFHQIYMITGQDGHNGLWNECNTPVCKTNYDVLVKLRLT